MKRQVLVLPAALVALGSVFSACGDGPDPVPTATVASTAIPAPTAATIGLKRADIEGKAGVQTTASGVKFVDLQVGSGISPAPTQMVEIHYTGSLASTGAQFDTSRDDNRTLKLAANGFIPGFSEALLTMKVGGRRLILIPAAQGYGANARPGIPANSDLVFDVELIAVN